MLLSRMFALLPLLMMTGASGVDADVDADEYSVYDQALAPLEVRTPAAKKQKQVDRSMDDDFWDALEIRDDGEGLDCYDVELERLGNQPGESDEDGVPDESLLLGVDELGEGDTLELKPIVKERRNSYTLAEKMHYVELCEAAWRDDPDGSYIWIAVSGVPEKDRVPRPHLLASLSQHLRALLGVYSSCLSSCATLMRGLCHSDAWARAAKNARQREEMAETGTGVARALVAGAGAREGALHCAPPRPWPMAEDRREGHRGVQGAARRGGHGAIGLAARAH